MPQSWPQEWSASAKYNSFNSYKGLTYWSSHYEPIAQWLEGSNRLPAPVEVSLDPIHDCNLRCGHCNAQGYLWGSEGQGQGKHVLSLDHMRSIVKMAGAWGVRGVCIAGGGEPLLNPHVHGIPELVRGQGMQAALLTNGSLITEANVQQIAACRWVGISVDAGSRETYSRVHGVPKGMFGTVLRGVGILVKAKEVRRLPVDIAYKFLIRPDNWGELYEACRLARELGVRDFHARPADLQRSEIPDGVFGEYDHEGVLAQMAKCHTLGDGPRFRVFTVTHKFDTHFRVRHESGSCYASPLAVQMCADGWSYVCVDHRRQPRFRLCRHSPDPSEVLRFWGSDTHRELIKGIEPCRECSRCTYGEYGLQIEILAVQRGEADPMCLSFP